MSALERLEREAVDFREIGEIDNPLSAPRVENVPRPRPFAGGGRVGFLAPVFILTLLVTSSSVVMVGIPRLGASSPGSFSGEPPVELATTIVDLTPGGGEVGSLVAASGSGLPANASVDFAFGGLGVATNCTTDAAGNFPGSTGSACDFLVPATPAGPTNFTVTSQDPGELSKLVGDSPGSVTYDSGTGALYVANQGSDNVSVFVGANHTAHGAVAVGSSPDGLVYDSGAAEIFVANRGSDDVSVIADSNDTVVSTISVGVAPSSLAYAPGLGELFVTNSGSDNVSVILDTHDTVLTSVAVGGGPDSAVYDSAADELFVANYNSSNVSVVAVGNSSVVASIPVCGAPWGVAFDQERNELFVSCLLLPGIDVISGTTDSVIVKSRLPNIPFGIAYDPALDGVVLSNEGSNAISVISDSNDSLVSRVAVGHDPIGLAYASGTRELVVANSGSDNITLVHWSQSNTVFTVNSSLVLNTSTGSADAGQTVSVQGTGYGSSVLLSNFSLDSISLACTNATNGTCLAGSLTTDPSGSFNAQFLAPVVPDSGVYVVNATDSENHTANRTLEIYLDPRVGPISAAPGSVDVGQSATLRVNATLGSGGYAYRWIGLPTGCDGATASIRCSPVSSGSFSILVQVTDSNGFLVNSTLAAFTVYADPEVGAPRSDPGSGSVDAGQSATFTEAPSFGTGTYASFTWVGLPGQCEGTTSSVTCAGADLPAGAFSISAEVTDSNNGTSLPSPSLAFVVDPDLTVALPTANRASGDIGESVTFNATATAGSGSYTYAWIGLPNGCSSLLLDPVSCTFTSAGSFAIQLTVTDESQFVVTSGKLLYTVNPDPTANLTASRIVLDVGQSLTLNATGALGSGGYSYAWSGLPPGCEAPAALLGCFPTSAGNFVVKVKITDSDNTSVVSAPIELTVAPALTAGFSAAPDSPTVDQNVEFQSTVSGGTGARTYSWQFGDGTVGSGSTADHAFTKSGTFDVTLWVNDSVGASTEKTLELTVATPSEPSEGSSSPVNWGIELVGVFGLIVAGVVGLLVVRSVRKPKLRSADSGDGPGQDPPYSQGEDSSEHLE
ncbi:MAG: PKD domain-containing protein [Thermoplasmata archaeon]|nr:PKD domain-containing protein [Thermoplasmata archaeon]